MQKDFHYYIMYVVARHMGYSAQESYIIAYASQYVDDNTDRYYEVEDSYGRFYIKFPEKIEDNNKRFHTIITQALSLDYRDIATQRYVYAPFHFLPAEDDEKNTLTIEGRYNPLCTVRDCENARVLLGKALDSRDPYRIGIALHTYADTWSHENFSAFEENWNSRRDFSIKKLMPSIGHAEFTHDPDIISKEWIDNRFDEERPISNQQRTLECLETLCKFIRPENNWDSIKRELRSLVEAPDMKSRIKMVKEMYSEIPTYDENRWIQEALKFERDPSEAVEGDDNNSSDIMGEVNIRYPRFVEIKFRDNFEQSHWYRFQIAAKKHLSLVISMIKVL